MTPNESITIIDRISLYSRLIIRIVKVGFSITHKLPTAVSMLGPVLKKKQHDPRYGHPSNSRRIDGRFYWQMNTPGFPSPAFDHVLRHWLAHSMGLCAYPGLYAAHVAITKQCSLNCLHCFEWESINQPETQTDEDIIKTVEQLIELGAAQIIFSGGEPVARFDFLMRLLNAFRDRAVQLWINTSGDGLTDDRIAMLKRSGLTGIIFSLDHHDRHAHDQFRGREGCYQQVISSAECAHELGLVTAFALCATNEYVSKDNLDAYMQLALDLNLTFVQILEPKPIGKYQGQEVSLKPEKQRILESIHDHASSCSTASGRQPLISYPDYHNRRYGCEGGKLHLYVDTDGRAYPCPFCKSRPTGLEELTPLNLEEKLACPNAAAFGT